MLRWKKEPKPTGLRVIGYGPLSSYLRDPEGVKYASVSALRDRYVVQGWYWVAGWDSGVPHYNSCGEPVETEQEAKAQAMAYVKEHLKKGQGDGQARPQAAS